MPNVALCTYKKTNSLSCLPAAGPAGHRPQCLTSLSAPTRKLTLLAVFHPEGRTGPAGHGPHCLTLLSEPSRNKLPDLSSSRQSSHTARLPRQNSTVLRDGPGLRATAATTCLPAAKAHTGRARHTETAGPRGTDGACGPWPPLPNVAF